VLAVDFEKRHEIADRRSTAGGHVADFSGLPRTDDDEGKAREQRRAAITTRLAAVIVFTVLGVIALLSLLAFAFVFALGRSL
jgi:hypothetical protein